MLSGVSSVLRVAAVASASGSSALVDAVTSTFRSSRYLRHAPPRLYVTCAHDLPLSPHKCGRHKTTVVDVSREVLPESPPHTQSVYLLTSTSIDDVDFADAESQSQVLVGLPHVESVDAVLRVCDTHVPAWQHIHRILIPGDVSPQQSLLVKHLLERLPRAQVCCNRFGQALLTNATFHDGVRRTVLENTPSVPLELLRFAELPVDRVAAVSDGDVVTVDTVAGGDAEGSARSLRVLAVKDTGRTQRRKAQGQTHHPAHFANERLFWYDNIFSALFVGHALHRLPWLTTALKEASRELLLPLPPSMTTQHPAGRPNPLLDTWHVSENCEDLVDALRHHPELERVLSGTYGELSGNVDECVAQLEKSSDALEELRSRLARRLATDTSRDVHRWSTALLRRLVQEVVCTQKASEPTTADMQEHFVSWAQRDGEWSRLTTCLATAAMVLPPTVDPTTKNALNTVPSSSTSSPAAPSAPLQMSSALEGQPGVELLITVLNTKGLQGLTRTVRRENVDVQVFLAMSEEDLKKVFKSTFGITKRLTLLQAELRKNL